MSKHTPTPWTVEGDEGYGPNGQETPGTTIIGPTGYTLALAIGDLSDLNSQANAAFIIKAVNAHDDLVEQLSSLFYCVEATGQTLGNMDAIRRLLRSLSRYTPAADTLAVKLGVDVEGDVHG